MNGPIKRLLPALCLGLLLPALASAGIAEHIARKKVDGIDLLVYPTAIHDVVTIIGALPAGTALALAEHDNAAVAVLTGRLLDRGTTKEDKFAISARLEDVGATISFATRDQALYIQARCLKKDLPLVLDLIAEQLRSPAFAPAELDKARQQLIGELKNQSDNVQARASEALRQAIYPPGHPNHTPTIAQSLAAAQSVTLDEIKAFHAKHYGPAHMVLVTVGDVTLPRVSGALQSAFKGWTGGSDYLRETQPATQSTPAQQAIEVEMPGKTSTVLAIGEATGLRDKDPDSLALEVGTVVLGSGFTGRLMHEVRDKEGLTYGISAGLSGNTFVDGAWQVSGTFAPQLLGRGTESTQREVHKWWQDGVTPDELTARKTYLVGSYQVGLATTSQMASAILDAVLSGRGVGWLDEYPKAVQAISLDQVNGAIKKYVTPDKAVVVKSGTLPKP